MVEEVLLEGIGISPGVATGPVCKTKPCSEGSIPVFEQLNPLDDLDMVAKAAAIVTEVGGKMSNIAVYAKENSVPGVSAIGATKVLKESQKIKVDGTEGIVYGVYNPIDEAIIRSEGPSLESIDQAMVALEKATDTDEVATLLVLITELFADASCRCEEKEASYGERTQAVLACNRRLIKSRDELFKNYSDLIKRLKG